MNRYGTLAILLISLGIGGPVAATETGIFLGGSVGYVLHDENADSVNAAMVAAGLTGNSDVDEGALGWKAYFGYNFTRYFGLEAGYVDLGEADGDFTVVAPVAGGGTLETDLSGYTLSAVIRYPFTEQLGTFAKIGGFFWDTDGRARVTAGGTTVVLNDDESGNDLTFGVGMKYAVSEHVAVRADWDRYWNVTDDDNDVDFFSVGFELNY